MTQERSNTLFFFLLDVEDHCKPCDLIDGPYSPPKMSPPSSEKHTQPPRKASPKKLLEESDTSDNDHVDDVKEVYDKKVTVCLLVFTLLCGCY